MEKAKIFQSIVKGSNFFTPIVDSYHTIGNHIIELSCSEKDNQHGLYNREVNGITFKGNMVLLLLLMKEMVGNAVLNWINCVILVMKLLNILNH